MRGHRLVADDGPRGTRRHVIQHGPCGLLFYLATYRDQPEPAFHVRDPRPLLFVAHPAIVARPSAVTSTHSTEEA
jgi:hypothetical protein